jgi:hypothetical protein
VATSTAPSPTPEPEGRRRATPWQVRTTLVRVLSETEGGLTIRELEQGVARELGHPLLDPIEADVESLLELGVIAEMKSDDRRLQPTDTAKRYLVGAEVLANE